MPWNYLHSTETCLRHFPLLDCLPEKILQFPDTARALALLGRKKGSHGCRGRPRELAEGDERFPAAERLKKDQRMAAKYYHPFPSFPCPSLSLCPSLA